MVDNISAIRAGDPVSGLNPTHGPPAGHLPSDQLSEGDANPTHLHFYGPVNQIGRVTSAAFGPNLGTMTQNANHASQSGAGHPLVYPLPFGSSGSIELGTLLNPIPDASQTRNRQLAPPNSNCLPGTRTKVIGSIMSWAKSTFFMEKQHILWVFGYAGCGKSAIAQAVADRLAEDRRLSAAFFFFRGGGERSRMSKFASTLACQIAAMIPGTAEHIEAALRAHPGLLNPTTSLVAQLKYLVYDPIRAVSAKWYRLSGVWKPFVVVVDGLDECRDKEDTTTFIKDLISLFERKPGIPLRFLITSRVEDHLHQQLYSSSQVRLLNLVEHTSHEDIEAALDAAIRDASGGRVLCGKEWLSRSDKERLIKHIGKSFIFMTTIVKVLFAPSTTDGLTPAARLPMVLKMDPGCGAGGPKFDDLYTSIFKSSQSLPHFDGIISTIALASNPLSIAELADLLDIEIASVVVVLTSLHSIIQVPGNDHTPITLRHTSLRDFLTSNTRSRAFYASPKHHRRLAYRFISLHPASPSPSRFSRWDLRHRATHHCQQFLESIENDTHTVQCEVSEILALLEITFPATFHIVVATYFHLDRQFWEETKRWKIGDYTSDTMSLIAALSPQREEAEVVLEILYGPMTVILGEGNLQGRLLAHMQQSHPLFLDAMHYHLEIVMHAIPLLVRVLRRTGGLFLDPEDQYLLVHWPRHLALAIRANPQHPAFDAVRPTSVQISGYGDPAGKACWPLPYTLVEEAASNLKLAEQAVGETFLSDALLDGRKWNWQKVAKKILIFGLDRVGGLCTL